MDFYYIAKTFIESLPYKQDPYCGRNWGHPWHSLCSYHGKLKPSIAHFLVEKFSSPGDIVLDPLSGVGTIPFEACLQGRVGIGNDLSKMAYTITKAKISKPRKEEAYQVLNILDQFIKKSINNISEDNLPYSDFGYNGKIPEYFHIRTYKQILCAREFFLNKNDLSAAESMVLACLLHVLHGNRPYALSRNSHPLTPYAPTGECINKDLIQHIIDKIELSYKKGQWDNYIPGEALFGDFSEVPKKVDKVNVIICSPPFVGSIKFYINNWMRFWFTGWEPQDYIDAENQFLEGRQKRGMDVYISFFEMCNRVLNSKGRVILHLGKSKKCDMAEELSNRAKPYFFEVYRGSETVENIEKHGIKDKGGTLEHQYLFLEKR